MIHDYTISIYQVEIETKVGTPCKRCLRCIKCIKCRDLEKKEEKKDFFYGFYF